MGKPSFHYEKRLWKSGFEVVVGIDEVGRGSFAGPVVAAACAFTPQIQNQNLKVKIDDSKKLSAGKRETADKWIKENAATWGIGQASASEINRVGLVKATSSSFRRAVVDAQKRLDQRINYLLIDAFYIPYLDGFPSARKVRKKGRVVTSKTRQQAIVDGDEKSLSIAAASIVAKVYRDDLMIKLGKKPLYKKYDWEKNKGYGTKYHRIALKEHGPTRYHRMRFIKNFLENKAI